MTETEDLAHRLEHGYPTNERKAAAALLRSQATEIENLHTVMMAAAVEITKHWDAHCDSEGYGPANLVRRLENGFPAQYGYDAQTVVRMEKTVAEQAAEIERLHASSKPKCKECATWVKQSADNAEWIESVKRGNEICKRMVLKAIKENKHE